MRTHVLGILVLALTSAPLVAQEPARAASAAASHAHELSRSEFDALLQKPDQVLIIDLRRPDELATIGGFSVYLSIQPSELEKSLALIPRERTIVTVSNRVRRSGEAADFLQSHGFKVAGALGARSYQEQGGALVKVAPPAP